MGADFRRIPSVDRVLAEKRLEQLSREIRREAVVEMVRQQLEQERQAVAGGRAPASLGSIVSAVVRSAARLLQVSPRPVINAAGVIIHTNLGRAPLSREAIRAMEEAGRSFTNLEFNLETGSRGSRNVHVEGLLCQLAGAEAALVVNNNASAIMLALSALARRKEVVVSRGQAVEIGGSFRIPDVMRQSGAKLIEVGTTNCTYAADYEQAISPATVALMRVHSSNFKVVGFVAEAGLEEMSQVAGRNNLLLLDDLGSGCFLDTTEYGLAPEPMVQGSVNSGADIICFSGDKLVGGPQAGIIVGRKAYVDRLRKHPLARAVRMDKVRLAGLSATLIHYLKGEAEVKIPVWRMISTPAEEIEKRAKSWAGVAGKIGSVIPARTMVGGGSLPGGTLPTFVLAISGEAGLAQKLARKLRGAETPVVGRLSDEALLLDPRTVLPEEDDALKAVLAETIAKL